MIESPPCPFCALAPDRIVWESSLLVAIRDGYPVSEGHTLVIPRRHVGTYFDATPEEQTEIWDAVRAIKEALDAELSPDGYNVGFNAGEAAGQTVPHLHVHVIPRWDGDMPDPRGGVRGVIPEKQKYGSALHPFADLKHFVPVEETPFSGVLSEAIGGADEIDIVVAFIQPTGLEALGDDLVDALARGARVRIVTGDYLQATHPDALRRLLLLTSAHEGLEAFFYLTRGRGTFHPKSYIFASGGHGVAYVGSSNLSRTGLTGGVEWNLRAISSDQPLMYKAVRDQFEIVLKLAAPLTPEVIDEYAKRARLITREEQAEALEPRDEPPTPHEVQKDALESLQESRKEGARRGLVVLATGLGKTLLAAFDAKSENAQRVLFIAHREEILDQAARAWAGLFPDAKQGMFGGGRYETEVDHMFSSIQTLAKHYKKFATDHFDYIVVDEFHHASARTYRKVLAHFDPQFLLGLTATPDRMDGASLVELCHDNLACEIGVVRGIAEDLLVPFHYFGVKDCIDYAPILWRNSRRVSRISRALTSGPTA